MRKGSLALLIATGVGLAAMSGAAAAPVGAAGLDKAFAKHSPIENARVYCMDRYTGEFLHWGPCGGPRWDGPRWDGPRWHERHEWGPGPGWGPWRHHHHWGY